MSYGYTVCKDVAYPKGASNILKQPQASQDPCLNRDDAVDEDRHFWVHQDVEDYNRIDGT